ncbi:LysR substrate-binding domain-containing protein [Mycobacterium sp. 21AC1]|uniref:LysR family transcriptional regulator n=1 Tax=[Mycobacterium] appelbergii TaxID=2939269 RepID=UPI002938F036|nr:LysR substrate-binding domain-containing protein [Mycobacterium sp. 21AC1]MDV3129525.1 LysR substrate-binding domain-containing protein [Mycobacterium sp. 21AC1]
MELRHLRYFVAVAEELSFTQAAKVLHISQPPLSQQISQLETELGVQLFERTPRRVVLTDTGRVLLEEARRILAGAWDMQRIAAGAAMDSIARPLRLASVTSGFSELLPRIVPKFRAANPGVALLIESVDPADQIHRIQRGELDIGVLRTAGGRKIEGLHLYPIEVQPFVAVLPIDHPLAKNDAVDMAELEGQDLLLLPRRRNPDYTDAVTSACTAAGFSPRIRFEPDDDQVLLGLVACGLGIGIVPSCVSPLRLPGTVYRPLHPPAPSTTLCLAQATNRPSPYFEALKDLATEPAPG